MARAREGENVEVARRSIQAFNRSVAEGSEDFYEHLHPEIEWVPITTLIDGRTYRGPGGVRTWMRELKRHWEHYELRLSDALDLGEGRVLAFGAWHARGRHGGVQLRFEQAAWLIELVGGRLARLQTFSDRTRALEAAGLRE